MAVARAVVTSGVDFNSRTRVKSPDGTFTSDYTVTLTEGGKAEGKEIMYV